MEKLYLSIGIDFVTFSFCLTLLIKIVFLIGMFCVFLWSRNWNWIFTGIGTEYRNVGTVTTLVPTILDMTVMCIGYTQV